MAGSDPECLASRSYLRHIFLESETAAAVLTCTPGDDSHSILTNPEIAATRELIDRLAGTGRLINHSIVHPNAPGELDRMGSLIEHNRPSGWKVYTLQGWEGQPGWRLDDEECGLPFLESSRELGVGIVCAHKGLSALAPAGSPADIGPAAARLFRYQPRVYHLGYRRHAHEEEGWKPEAPGHRRRQCGRCRVGPGGNVCELGSTWYVLSRRPREAAHVIGKLLNAVGEDNVLWGSDSIWYGSPQPLIDAFRAFQIPEELRQRHGYPELTSRIKEKILGLNAARV